MTALAFVRKKKPDIQRLQGCFVERQGTFDIADRQNHETKHCFPPSDRDCFNGLCTIRYMINRSLRVFPRSNQSQFVVLTSAPPVTQPPCESSKIEFPELVKTFTECIDESPEKILPGDNGVFEVRICGVLSARCLPYRTSGIHGKRLAAAWDHDYLLKLLVSCL
jgi:hypothetical protein